MSLNLRKTQVFALILTMWMPACLVALPMLTLTAKAQSATTVWNPAENPKQPSDGLWTDPANWSTDLVPNTNDVVVFDVIGAIPCVIDNTAGIATCWRMNIGQDGAGSLGTLIVTNGGAFAAVGDYCSIGYSGAGTMDVENGCSATFPSHLWIGYNTTATGTFIVNGGTVSVAGAFGLGFGGGTGIARINGGTLTLSEWLPNSIQGSNSVLDIRGGTGVISGTQVMDSYVASGKITAYGGTGTVNVNYNGGVTTLTATSNGVASANMPVFLSINLSATNLALCWPASAEYCGLQSTTNLLKPIGWQTVTNDVVTVNGTNEVILSLPGHTTFFSLNQGVDATTMNHKLLMGYQGWFGCPNDGSAPNEWWHWFRNLPPTATNINTDIMPDLSGLGSNELFYTEMTYSNGSPVPFYSAAVQQTVVRHFQWMQQNQLDGVFLQRFVTDLSSPDFFSFRNQVTKNVRVGAETYGRVFAIMYDVSGEPTNTLVSDLTNDWVFLVNSLHVTDSPRYLHHKGKPVVAIWGFGFNDAGNPATPQQAQAVINWFKSQGVTVMGGVPTYWRTLTGDSYTDPAWTPVYLSFDVLSPWSVGRYYNNAGADNYTTTVTTPDLAECASNGIDYMPVVFPGFSWFNENGGPLNQIPRNGGSFYWEQVYDDVQAGCKMIYGAMFDEVNEGTAMYKLAPTAAQLPAQGSFIPLNIDGITLNSDWYLRLANQAGKMLRGEILIQNTIHISPP